MVYSYLIVEDRAIDNHSMYKIKQLFTVTSFQHAVIKNCVCSTGRNSTNIYINHLLHFVSVLVIVPLGNYLAPPFQILSAHPHQDNH